MASLMSLMGHSHNFLEEFESSISIIGIQEGVKLVPWGQEIIEVRNIPMRIAPLTWYIMRKTVRIFPVKIPSHIATHHSATTKPISGNWAAAEIT
jgi:hypothetical protein